MTVLIALLSVLMLLFPAQSNADVPVSETIPEPQEEVVEETLPVETQMPISTSTSETTTETSTDTHIIKTESLLSATVSIIFPRLSIRDFEQSALKPGDQFTIRAQNIAVTFNDVTVDLHELGLSTNVSMSKESAGSYSTIQLRIPANVTDGVKNFVIHAKDNAGNSSSFQGTVKIDTDPPTGTLVATFSKSKDLTGTWKTHISGTFNGTGSVGKILNEYTYGVDKDGKNVDGSYTSDADSILRASSPFSLELPILPPDITWSAMGYGITIVDEAGNSTEVKSNPVALTYPDVPLIDHAITGSIVNPSNYVPGNIPSGVGIPYSLINTLPKGDYFATVFFNGLGGCPSANYQINAFIPGNTWGVGIRPDLYQKAYRTSTGGCMQQFNIDPNKGEGWMWGALSNTDSAPAIADDNHIPAFAICATAAVCDKVLPHSLILPPQPLGISNVLFLPGIEGSPLYHQNAHCDDASGVCDAPLWLPPNDLFVPQLFLDTDGKSVNTDIYARDGDILTQAYGRKFYTTFAQGLDSIQTSGKFGIGWKWKAVAYDWRLSLADIATNGVERNGRIYYEEASSTPYIEQTLRQLAASSKTGKVTIIAHSNGGLVAKALMNRLGDAETDALVDKVIFVGTPHSGVPEAIGALLYGDKQGIPGLKYITNAIMSTAHARTLGSNSSMAYSLLPTDTYFQDVPDPLHPLISFTASTLWAKERAAYGRSITDSTNLRAFLLARDGGRTKPAPSNLAIPNILNQKLYDQAALGHISLDAWLPTDHVKVYQIAGWGADTVSGIDLYERPKTVLGVATGEYKTAYRPSFVEDGDGTVTIPSALGMFSSPRIKRYWENLQEVKVGSHRFTHTDLFEIPQLQSFIQNLIAGSEELTETIYTKQPATTNPLKKLVFILHSVADISLRDTAGHATGIRDNDITESIEESTYGEIGEVQYIIAPSNQPYELAIAGTSSEPFTLDIQEMVGNVVTASTTIADVPMTNHTSATLSTKGDIQSLSWMEVDTDGDGTTDFSIEPFTGEIQYSSSTSITVQTPVPEIASTTTVHSSSGGSKKSARSTTTRSTPTEVPIATTTVSVLPATNIPEPVAVSVVPPSEVPSRAVGTTSKPIPEIKNVVTVGSTTKDTHVVPSKATDMPSNQMAAVPESALLRLLSSIWTYLSHAASFLIHLLKMILPPYTLFSSCR